MNQTPVAKAVAEIYHARLGASGVAGWLNCADWAGGGGSTIYSATGSVIHEVSAVCLDTDATSNAADYIGQVFTSGGFAITFTAEHAATAQVYIDYCRDLYKTIGGQKLVELSLPIDHLTGEANAVSTIDFGIVPPPETTEGVVVDLKTGAGVAVEAEDNGQGVMYALAMLDQYSLVSNIHTVRIVIVQPPLNSISEWVISVADLEIWRARFAEAAALALSPNPKATPSTKACRWCSKKANCAALDTVVFEAVEAVDPTDVPSDDLGVAMGKVEMIEGWIKAVRAETEKRLLDGRTVPGFKLVQGKRGNRQWSNATEVEALFKAMRLKESEMYDFKLVSPTTADKLSKDGTIGPKQWIKVQQMITQKDGAPSVAPESDKRPALAGIDFQQIGEVTT